MRPASLATVSADSVVDHVRRFVFEQLATIPEGLADIPKLERVDLALATFAFPREKGGIRSLELLSEAYGDRVGIAAAAHSGKNFAYLLVALADGAAIEAWVDPSSPERFNISRNGLLIGRVETVPADAILKGRKLLETKTVWRLWNGDALFGCIRDKLVVGPDSLKIERAGGDPLPLSLAMRPGPMNTVIPSRLVQSTEDDRVFYCAVSLAFRLILFNLDSGLDSGE
jgi:hypothetical protein